MAQIPIVYKILKIHKYIDVLIGYFMTDFFDNFAVIVMCEFISVPKHLHPYLTADEFKIERFSEYLSRRAFRKIDHCIVLNDDVLHDFPGKIKCDAELGTSATHDE